MPSKKEGFGYVFLEALACGKPVIAGNCDGSRDPLLDGELGQLVDPDNVDEVADAIRRVVDNSLDGRLLDGAYLRRRVVEEFGIDRFNQRVTDILVSVT